MLHSEFFHAIVFFSLSNNKLFTHLEKIYIQILPIMALFTINPYISSLPLKVKYSKNL